MATAVRDPQDGTAAFGHVLLSCGLKRFVVQVDLDILHDLSIDDPADTFIYAARELFVKGFDRSGPNVSLGPRSVLFPGFVTQRAIIPGPGAGEIHIGDAWQGVTASLVQPPPSLSALPPAAPAAPPPAPALARSLTNDAPLCAPFGIRRISSARMGVSAWSPG